VAVLMDFFFAGTETTGTIWNWLLLYLVLHPDVQEKARAEIFKVSNGDLNGLYSIPGNK